MKMKHVPAALVLLALMACGGTTDPVPIGPGTPAGPAAVEAYVAEGFLNVTAVSTELRGILSLLFDPEALLEEEGATLTPDLSPGAPPNAYLFDAALDSDGDGNKDAALTGSGVLSDPIENFAKLGFSGTIEFDVDLGVAGRFTGTLSFRTTLMGILLWGAVEMRDDLEGTTTRVTAPEATPLTIALPLEAPNEDANLCHLNVRGTAGVAVESPAGTYAADWLFQYGSHLVTVTGRSWLPEGSTEPEPLPDATEPLDSCQRSAIYDWEGRFILEWECIPTEFGDSLLTFQVIGPRTVRAWDEELDQSGTPILFELTADAGNPHVLRGFFLETTGVGTYREDVVFTLADDLQTWTQDNEYVFINGPSQGEGGTCIGTGTRQP